MSTNVAITKARTVRIDSELWNTSEWLLKAGQERAIGYAHQFRTSLVFTAFALEAYLNHIGPLFLKTWGGNRAKAHADGEADLALRASES